MKLIEAVGEIIRTEGYTKLGVNRIAGTAGVSKKLIYRYFGNAENLIETYVRGKDYWMAFDHLAAELVEQHRQDAGKDFLATALQGLFGHLSESTEAQRIILWEVSEKSRLMSEISATRERLGTELFAMTDPFFARSEVDIRAVCALLLGGVYYLILHSNATGGTFCGIELKTAEGRDRILKTIRDVISWSYNRAEQQSSFRAPKSS